MTSTRWLAPIALVVAGACAPSAPPAGAPDPAPLELRLRLPTGARLGMLMTTEQATETTVMGQEQNSRQTTAFEMLVEVLDVAPDGDLHMRFTIGAVRFHGDGPMGPVEYDSEDPTAPVPMAARAHAVMAGQGFAMRLAPNGDVRGVEGVDAMMQRLYDEMDIPAGPMREQMKELMGGMFGDEGIVDMMRPFTGVLPDDPVRVGDSWSRSQKMVVGFPIAVDSTWTLAERRSGTAHVTVASTIASGDDSVIEMGPMRMRQRFAGEQTGTIEIDEATGWTLRSRLETSFAGTTQVEGVPGAGGEFPMSVTSITTIEPLPDAR